MLSVVLRVKMISRLLFAFRKDANGLARVFVSLRRGDAQRIEAAQRVGVLTFIKLRYGVQHALRALRRRGVV